MTFFLQIPLLNVASKNLLKYVHVFLGIFQTEKVAILNRNENICKKDYVLNFYHYCLQKKVRYILG